MLPELFHIPAFGPLKEPLVLHTYGVLIAAGFVLVTQMLVREARREGEPDPDRYSDLAFYLLLVGLGGSRILFIIVNWNDYKRDPLEMLMFWRGGLVFYGGFLLALGYAVVWAKMHKESFFRIADIFIPMVAFNHAWGRLGCLSAGCCYGRPTKLPWGIQFPIDSAVQATQHAQGLIGLSDRPLPVHPTQVYEAFGEMALFLLLVWMRGKKRFHGELLLIWLVAYPIMRSIIEIFRGDSERGYVVPGILSTSQFVSIFVVLLALGLMVYLRRRPVPALTTQSLEQPQE